MRPTFARRSILASCAGAGAMLLTRTARSQGATTTYTANMNGSSEVPPNTTTGTGSATVTIDANNKITWNVSFSGLTGPAFAVHIHGPAPVGKNAGVLIWLSTKGKTAASPVSGSATFTAGQASDLSNGLCYVNVHTKANPGGEIRGQLVKS
jgi:hypothetical protein